MRYLCNKHAAIVRSEPAKAYTLWRGARAEGIQAMRDGRLREAQSLLGVAYDIARLQLADDITEGSCRITSERFAESVRYHALVLNRSHQMEELSMCIEAAHDGLLHRAQSPSAAYGERVGALHILSEFRIKRVSLLKLMGQSIRACAWGAVAEKLALEVQEGLTH